MIYIFKNSVNSWMYVCIDQKLRLIPTSEVFHNLFPKSVTYLTYNNDQIIENQIGTNLPNECRLVREEGQAPVYLIDQESDGSLRLRHIASEETMNDYQFDWNNVQELPSSDPTWNIAKGPDISNLGPASNTWMHRLQVDFSVENGPAVRMPHMNVIHRLGKENDLFCIWKNGTDTHKTEVHQLTVGSNYSKTSLQIGTAFPETDEWWDFVIAPDNNDLVGIMKQNTASNKTEVHILSAESQYQKRSLDVATGLDKTDHNWQFAMAPNRDLFCILQQGGSNKTEVHVLSAASHYSEFILHTATAFPICGANCDFSIDGERNLVACLKWGTKSTSTEVHILTAASNYQTYALQTGTAMPETDSSKTFMAAANLDVYMVFSENTGSNCTEVHMLSTASHYRNFGLHAATPFKYSDTANFQMKQGEVALYEGPNYTGCCWYFSEDCSSLSGIRPVSFGSIKVGAGTGVLLYDGNNYEGTIREIIQSNDKLLSNVGSFKIYNSENPAKAQIGSSVLLTEDYRRNTQGQMESYKAYQTIVNVPPGAKTLEVWAEKLIKIHVDDQIFTIDQVQSATLKVGAMNNVVISTEATAIGTASLRVRTDQMAANDYVLIFPDRHVHQKVAALPDGTLHANRDALGIKPNVSQEDCDHVQKSVQNMARAVKYPTVDSLAPPSITHEDMDDKHWKLDFTENGPKYAAISAEESQQILNGATVNSAGALWWPADEIEHAFHAVTHVVSDAADDVAHGVEDAAKTVAHGVVDAAKDVGHVAEDAVHEVGKIGSIVVHSIDHVVKDAVSEASKGLHAIEGPIQGAVMAIGGGVIDLGKDIEHGVIDAADAVAGGIESAVAMTIQFADRAISFVVSHVEQIGKVIGMVLEQIGAEIMKIVNFLASLFDWDEIVRIKNYINHTINEGLGYIETALPGMKQMINEKLDTVETDLNNTLDEARQFFHVPNDTNNSGTSSLGDEALHKIMWFVSKIIGSGNSLTGGLLDEALPKALVTFEEKIVNLVGEDLLDTFEELISKFESFIKNPSQAPQLLIGFFLDMVQRMADGAIDALKLVIDAIIDLVDGFVKKAQDWLNADIDIPIISDIIKLVTGSGITYMDLLGFVIAIPMEIIEKIKGTKFFNSQVSLSVDGDLKFAFSIANGIATVVGGIVGSLIIISPTSVPVLGELAFAVGLSYQIFRWPGGYPQLPKLDHGYQVWPLFVWGFQWANLILNAYIWRDKKARQYLTLFMETIRLGLEAMSNWLIKSVPEFTTEQKISNMLVPFPAIITVVGQLIPKEYEEAKPVAAGLLFIVCASYCGLVIDEGYHAMTS